MTRHQLASYPLRIPEELREQIALEAVKNKRSLNAEMASRLENSLTCLPPGVTGGSDTDEILRRLVAVEGMLEKVVAVLEQDDRHTAIEEKLARLLEALQK